MSRHAFAAAAVLTGLVASSVAMAAGSANATTPFTVRVVITESCTVETSGTVQLGEASGMSASQVSGLLATGVVTATCTGNVPYELKLTSGNSTNPFNMKSNIANNSGLIPYAVSLTSVSGTGATYSGSVGELTPNGREISISGITHGTGDKSYANFTFTARQHNATMIDTYSDTVSVTLSY